ncbi:C40 family peptidase [Paenibacillus cremeus]|uniref:NlpC/P60 family protein n=1 Tax=Paenibacillus cremeus TaxID=2163881 RepID=A0A559K414_9BACL|nr:NlpC/P60 family protein [Paenibacillus cremeus]TVY06872.1 NlpC/P60 family protein [Paenibacillus cremeus]
MKHTKKLLTLLGTVMLLTGCGAGNNSASPTPFGTSSYQGSTDDRLFNPAVADRDPLLQKGDASIEQVLHGYRAQDASTNRGSGIRMLGSSEFVEVLPDPAVAPQQGSYAENAIATAYMYYGAPYQYGSDRTDPSTFDCSDFTHWVFLYALGMDLPKDSRAQARYVQTFSKRTYTDITQAQRGDLLFFGDFRGVKQERYVGVPKTMDSISHCGIALGNGKIIHTASKATGGVRVDELSNNHLEWRFIYGGSVLDVQ